MTKLTLETILLHLGLTLLFNMLFAVRRSETLLFSPSSALFQVYLPPHVRSLLNQARHTFEQLFPEDPPSPRPVGRPRLPRKPFFLIWVWNRLVLRKPPTFALALLAQDASLCQFFEVPPTGLKKTTYNTFVKDELSTYLERLLARNVAELLDKRLLKGLVLAGDDFALESSLNLSKSIDFPTPQEADVHAVFQALPPLDWVDAAVGTRPNKHRGWADYLKFYLFYLLWGFPSQATFNRFLKDHLGLSQWLQLERRAVQAGTFSKYLQQLTAMERAAVVLTQLCQQLLRIPTIQKRLPSWGRPQELDQLYGLMGNAHGAKDPGTALHYQASKGRYFFGRMGRILVDTWSQIPLWATVTTAGQPLAEELQRFGQQVTRLLQGKVKPLLALFDSGFQGEARLRTLRRGFATVWQILFTRPYQRGKSGKDLFRIERLAVERAIGHLTVQLDLETPRQRGLAAAHAWVLGTVYLQQIVALWNASHMPKRPLTGLVHFRV